MGSARDSFLKTARGSGRTLRLAAALSAAATCAAAAPASLSLSPDTVLQGMRYAGADIAVTASAPRAQAYMLRLLGPSGELHLMRKGRVWGVWMSVGEEDFEDVPALCLTATSPGLEPGAPEAVALGCPALARAANLSKEAELTTQMIELKRSEGLFGDAPGTVSVSEDGPGRSRLRAVLHLPAKAPPARYEVELFAKTPGGLEALAKAPLELRESGLPAALGRLLDRHPLLYGILAVLIACAAGLAIGYVFGKVEH